MRAPLPYPAACFEAVHPPPSPLHSRLRPPSKPSGQLPGGFQGAPGAFRAPLGAKRGAALGLGFARLGWARLGWAELGRQGWAWRLVGLALAGRGWAELGGAWLGEAGLDWAELGWAGLSWAGLGCTGLGGAGLGWAGLRWSRPRPAHSPRPRGYARTQRQVVSETNSRNEFKTSLKRV